MLNVGILSFNSMINSMLRWAEHEKGFLTSGPDLQKAFLVLVNLTFRIKGKILYLKNACFFQ